MPLQLKKLYN